MKFIEKIYAWLRDRTSRPDERGAYSAGYWQNKVREKALSLVKGCRGRLLEVGCGEGFFLARLAKRNPHIKAWGVDMRPEVLAQARRLLERENIKNVVVREERAEKLSFDSGFFDAVVCVNLFICLPSMDAVRDVICEMARVCKKGARLILEFRNRKNVFLRIKYALAPFYDTTIKDHPLSTYDEEKIDQILRECGFAVVRKHYLDFPFRRLAPIIIAEARKNGP